MILVYFTFFLSSKELIYQRILQNFGEMDSIRLSSPAPLNLLCMIALDHPRSGWEPQDGEKDKIAEVCALIFISLILSSFSSFSSALILLLFISFPSLLSSM
jgi:hypothetical protein